MTVTLLLREPTPYAEALVSGERISSALPPHGTLVGRTHPADCDGLRLQFSPTSHRRPTRRPFRVKHVRVDIDLAALSLPHPTQGIANGRHGSTRKGRPPTIFSFRRHFAYTASTSPMTITEIAAPTLRSVKRPRRPYEFRMHEAPLDKAWRRATTIIAILPPTQAIAPTDIGNWSPRPSAPTVGHFPQFSRVDMPTASHADPKPTLSMPSLSHWARRCFWPERRLGRLTVPPGLGLTLRSTTGSVHPLDRLYWRFHSYSTAAVGDIDCQPSGRAWRVDQHASTNRLRRDQARQSRRDPQVGESTTAALLR
jgi:hypothetical protein